MAGRQDETGDKGLSATTKRISAMFMLHSGYALTSHARLRRDLTSHGVVTKRCALRDRPGKRAKCDVVGRLDLVIVMACMPLTS